MKAITIIQITLLTLSQFLCLELGCSLDSLESAKKDFQTQLEKADTNDPGACYNVGSMFATGVNGPRDLERSMQYFEQSAKLGNPIAWYSYGKILEEIRPQLSSDHYFNLAAQKVKEHIANKYEFSNEQIFVIGEFYWSGLGTIQMDRKEARKWWEVGKSKGDEGCAYQLAIDDVVWGANGTSRGPGLDALCNLASNGHPLAIYVLHAFVKGWPSKLRAEIVLSKEETPRAWQAVHNGIDQLFSDGYLDDRKRTFFAADCLWSGIGLAVDKESAIAHWVRSVELGNFFSADVLIAIYLGLIGDEKFTNIDLAKKYIEYRSHHGDVASNVLLREIVQGKTPSPLALAPFRKTLSYAILDNL